MRILPLRDAEMTSFSDSAGLKKVLRQAAFIYNQSGARG